MKKRYDKYYVIQYPPTGLYFNRRHKTDGLTRNLYEQKNQNSTYLTSPAEATKYISRKSAEKALARLIQAEYEKLEQEKAYSKKYTGSTQYPLHDPEPFVKIYRECIVVEVQGNPTDNQIEFALWMDYYDKSHPTIGTGLKKSHAYCQACGLKIPRHVPYFGGKFKTGICIICMKHIAEEALRVYADFARDNPAFIENYMRQTMIRKL